MILGCFYEFRRCSSSRIDASFWADGARMDDRRGNVFSVHSENGCDSERPEVLKNYAATWLTWLALEATSMFRVISTERSGASSPEAIDVCAQELTKSRARARTRRCRTGLTSVPGASLPDPSSCSPCVRLGCGCCGCSFNAV